jgi:hypothetical protein
VLPAVSENAGLPATVGAPHLRPRSKGRVDPEEDRRIERVASPSNSPVVGDTRTTALPRPPHPDPAEAGQLPDRGVHPPGCHQALVVTEQVRDRAPWRNDGFYVPTAAPDRDSSGNRRWGGA